MTLVITPPKTSEPDVIARNRIVGLRVEHANGSTIRVTPGAARCSENKVWIENDGATLVPLSGNVVGASISGLNVKLSVWACKSSGTPYYKLSRSHTVSAFQPTQPAGTRVRRIGAVSVHTTGDIRRHQSAGDDLEVTSRYFGYNSTAMGVYDSLRFLHNYTGDGGPLQPADNSRWFTPPGTIRVIIETYISAAGYCFFAVEGDSGSGQQQTDHNFVLTRDIDLNFPGGGNFAHGSEPRIMYRQTSGGTANVSLAIRQVTVTRLVYL